MNANSSTKININNSSLMGLKAELLRKQAEIEELKKKNESNPSPLLIKPKKEKPPAKPKVPRITKKEYADLQDQKRHEKSKLMLEAKSRLYDNLKKSHKNVNPNYLVDFVNKSDSEDEDKVATCKKEKANDETSSESGSDFEDNDDDWVEYVDCFGRTRKCLKEDLPAMKEKDRLLGQKVYLDPAPEEVKEEKPPRPVSPSREVELEKMRKKWEAQMERLTNKNDIHYQDVLFDEARTHGVGYFAFSQDEELRKKQQESLNQLRKETLEKQRQAKEVREKKLLMERNRLRAAKVRQKVRMGLAPELTEEEMAEIDAKYNLTNEKEEKEEEKEEKEEEKDKEDDKEEKKKSLAEIEDKIGAFGELLGKRNKFYTMSQEEWVDKRRKLRDSEFAPVYDNFVKSKKKVVNSKEESSDEESSEEEDVIGPLPPKDEKKEEKEEIDDPIMAGLKYLRAKFEGNSSL